MVLNDPESITVLVVAPTPTHPPVQGNRQRIFDLCRAMQSMGADLTILEYATDGIDVAIARQMKEAWGNLDIVFPRGFSPAHTLVRYPAIDDWYDGDIGTAASRLSADKRFDICWVNYAWYSKVFESLPEQTVRVIDTHDIFGGRAERFQEIGIEPEWYHTSVEQESIGLNRADFVLAIQDIEAETLRQRTVSQVHSVGFLSAPNWLPVPTNRRGNKLTVGYIGSGNPFNVSALLDLQRALLASPEASALLEIHVAGPICTNLSGTPHDFVTHGIVANVVDFYSAVDVVVNPMQGGTGLKIKSLEALSFGKPLVATLDAMAGIPSEHPGHRLTNCEQIVAHLRWLAEHKGELPAEADASRRVFQFYRHVQLRAFSSFWSCIEREVSLRRTANVPCHTGVSS